MLNVYKSNYAEHLVDALVHVLLRPNHAPLEPEIIVVQSLGTETWLRMHLANQLGICANVKFPFPRAFIDKVLSTVLCDDSLVFEAQRLTWAIMALMRQFIDKNEFASLKNYLAGDIRGIKYFQLACEIAYVFDQYAVYRPDMVLEWEQKEQTHWQAILWNALVKTYSLRHIAHRAQAFVQATRVRNIDATSFPKRVSLFGISTLPPIYLHILANLSQCVQVNLFLLTPCKEYWVDIQSKYALARRFSKKNSNIDEKDLHFEQGNYLLACLGDVGRDFERVLEDTVDYTEPQGDLFVDPLECSEECVLRVLQSDILNLRNREPDSLECKPLSISDDDTSLAIHSCHTLMREIEVLYDQVRAMLEADPTLAPRDIIVMTLDIDTYAPFIEAIFTPGKNNGERAIPYTISDRCIQSESTVTEAFFTLLGMARTRVFVDQVFDLLRIDSVRKRFHLTEDDIDVAYQWVCDSGVRWGVDSEHRIEFEQPRFKENTWYFGLERLFLGYAMPGERQTVFQSIVPYDQIEGNTSEVLGHVARYCETLFDCIKKLQKPHTLIKWQETLEHVLECLIVRTEHNTHEHQLIHEALRELVLRAKRFSFTDQVHVDVIQSALASCFKKTQKNFFSKGITFCNLAPMQNIPFRVVWLMGLTTEFPRVKRTLSFDQIAKHPRCGDRTKRAEDRYLFLEALLAARERFIISYVGQSISDNSPIPSSVVVDELLDTIEQTFYSTSSIEKNFARERFVILHPLQPFSKQYFTLPTTGQKSRLISYNTLYLEAAKSYEHESGRVNLPFLPRPLPFPAESERNIDIEDLVRFFKMPVNFLLTRRLNLHIEEDEEIKDQREPMKLSSLESYKIGTWLLEQAIDKGCDELRDFSKIFQGSGILPLGTLGEVEYTKIVENVKPLVEDIRHLVKDPLLPNLCVNLELEKSVLTCVLSSVRTNVLLQFTYAQISPKREVELWIRHLALNCVNIPGYPKTSVLIARGKRKKKVDRIVLPPIASNPHALLADLVQLYWCGQTQGIRFFPKTSYAYAESIFSARRKQNSAEKYIAAIQKAYNKWGTTVLRARASFPGEGGNPSVRRVFGHTTPLEDVTDDPEKSFSSLAMRVFAPYFARRICV